MSLTRRLDGASNVLLLVPSMAEAEADVCIDLLTPRPPGHENVLYLEFTLSSEERMKAWHNDTNGSPADVRFVRVGKARRPLTVSSTPPRAVADGDYAEYDFETASDPGSLVRMGSTIESIIDDWVDGPHQIVFCMHSLTAFLQYVDVRQAFRFLNVLTEQLADVGALAHYHMDPAAHDPKEVNIVKQLFDTIVEVGTDGEVNVVQRYR